MRLVPVITHDKREAQKKILDAGGEGQMLKDAGAPYVQKGRPKSMFKYKRREEIDAFVTGFSQGKKGKGWELLIGDIEFSCFTELGKVHMVAKCSNLTLEKRIEASICRECSCILDVRHDNIDGKRTILGTSCTGCGVKDAGAALNPQWYDRVAEVSGQEWTAKVYRMKHAVIEKWRITGEDRKDKDECKVNLQQVKQRFINAARAHNLDL